MQDTNKTVKATWNAQSARFIHELTKAVKVLGVRSGDTNDATAAVIGAMRRNIAEKACKQLLVQTKNQGEKLKEVKEHTDKQRATGALLKLKIGTTEEWFLGLCDKGVQTLVRADQALAGLEKTGDGIQWSPVPGSNADEFIRREVQAFKIRENYAALDAADSEHAAAKAAEEAAMLLGK